MGYVTVTEFIGGVSKSYRFESYDDFKDWENKISGVVLTTDDLYVETDSWTETLGEKPLISEDTVVQVMFGDGSCHSGPVGTWVWANFNQEDDITHYRVVSK